MKLTFLYIEKFFDGINKNECMSKNRARLGFFNETNAHLQ